MEKLSLLANFDLSEIHIQLASVPRAVVSQQLVPGVGGELIPVYEILRMNSAIKSLIRDNKGHQIDNAISSGGREGMRSMDQSLLALYRQGSISRETAIEYSDSPEQLRRQLG